MMTKLTRILRISVAGLFLSLGLGAVAHAQILIVDDDRVEKEAAAYKDFNLQTVEFRQNILQLRQYISRGGVLEQQLADLEKRKSIIGADKYEEERNNLANQMAQAQQSLAVLEYQFDKLRQEAMVQVERARQPVIRALLDERQGQVIMLKRLVLGHASGMDVTTEFIERLDSELPSVTLNLPERAAGGGGEGTGNSGGN
ncbi:OmpH family outer membrane protein [Eilatimonas milleporae]|uniref:Periplasmic chaperone for outer membrane proteins Skp n=1 Tax=Eilatimonas milleporae TaxID=911205 RepID=A0A3M0CPL9_9PROT|nr:hypothetical protein [Eilatimonas milleporae]RMB08809.1 hypothetical protein BXY39_1450 [Eilatimonas milleporae]